MKKKLILFSTILLISIMVAGGTFAWFLPSTDLSLSEPEMGTVEVDVIQRGLGNIRIKNSGTNEIYMRIRLIPKWSNENLSVSNVKVEVSNDWIERDGYYYYKKAVKSNEITNNLIKDITYTDITPEYKNESFTLKVAAEVVQSTHGAWKDTWNINSLPF